MDIDLALGHSRVDRGHWRSLVLQLLGPGTALAGTVWAVAQPYRITFLDPREHSVWDLVAQPPLLVVLVAILFHLSIARPLARELEEGG